MDKDAIKGKMDQGIGAAKEKVGDMRDDPEMEAEGRQQQGEGKAREMFGKAKDAVDDAVDAVSDKTRDLKK